MVCTARIVNPVGNCWLLLSQAGHQNIPREPKIRRPAVYLDDSHSIDFASMKSDIPYSALEPLVLLQEPEPVIGLLLGPATF